MSSAEENLGMIMFRWPNVPSVPGVPGALKRYAGSWKYRDFRAEKGLLLSCVLWPLQTLHQLSHESGLSWDGLTRKPGSCKRDFCSSQHSRTSKLRFSGKEQMFTEENHPGGSRHRNQGVKALPWECSQERDGAPSHVDPRSFENRLVPPPQVIDVVDCLHQCVAV